MQLKKIFILSSLSLTMTTAAMVTGCAGHTPHPVATYQPDDNQLTCSQIDRSIQYNQQEMYRLYPKTQKTGKNVALGITGSIFIVPLFFMDFSDAEQIEINAFQQRDQHLHFLAERKHCGGMPPRIVLQTKPKRNRAK